MAVYQINRNMKTTLQAQIEAITILDSVMRNATEGYGFLLQDISLDGAGRLRVRLSSDFPQSEIDSFNGDIIAV